MSDPTNFKIEDSAIFKAIRDPDLLMHSPGHQGWQQMLNWKRELLSAYDRARHYARGHEVETYHGIVAEAHFRNWLSEFLPKKYGVTAGYIVSQGAPAGEKTPAFDVIIYDQLESPVLWVETHPDVSPQGKMRALPAEYVKAVIEVKAALTTASAKDAVEHLADLKPIMGADEPDAPFKCHLPPDFTCWAVFFDLRQKEQTQFGALNHLADAIPLRGFIGAFVLRGEGLDEVKSGEVSCTCTNSSNNMVLPSANTLLEATCFSDWRPLPNGWFGQTSLSWSRVTFAAWPFHLLRLLNGQRSPQSIPSLYGMPPIGRPSE
jgi:hypothetical protein